MAKIKASGELGKGATFDMYFPMHEPEQMIRFSIDKDNLPSTCRCRLQIDHKEINNDRTTTKPVNT